MLRLRLRMARPRFASPAKLLENQGYSVPASSSARAMARDPTARDSSATPPALGVPWGQFSTLILASLITGPHFSVSDFRKAASSA